MLRPVFVVGLVAVTAAASVDLGACGDKFLRAGRSGRMRHYAAMYPASIILYAPASVKPEGLKEWEKMLKGAGHKALVVRPGDDLSRAVASARYDLVIADYRETEKVSAALEGMPSKPGVLPVLSNANKALVENARKQYPQLITPATMHEFQALETIDELMAVRLKMAKK